MSTNRRIVAMAVMAAFGGCEKDTPHRKAMTSTETTGKVQAAPVSPWLALDESFFELRLEAEVVSTDGKLVFVTEDTGQGGTMPDFVTTVYLSADRATPIRKFDYEDRLGWPRQVIRLPHDDPTYAVVTWDKYSAGELSTALVFFRFNTTDGLIGANVAANSEEFMMVEKQRISFPMSWLWVGSGSAMRQQSQVAIRCSVQVAGQCKVGVAEPGELGVRILALDLSLGVDEFGTVEATLDCSEPNWRGWVLAALQPSH
ncbi:MAG: hypothetical protein KDA60_21985 [Planctomycetales bacterium]|nr:hypothetical protein [Planctomycetales bacterium]